MMRNIRTYIICGIISAGLVVPSARAEEIEKDLMRIFPPLAALVVVGGVIYALILKYKTTDSERLVSVEGNLAAFKTETNTNFNAVLGTQTQLTQQQGVLVQRQGELQQQVSQVDAKVSAAQAEIKDLKKTADAIKIDTADIRIQINELNVRLDAQRKSLAEIQVGLASTASQDSVDELDAKLEIIRKAMLKRGDVADEVRQEFDRVKAEHVQYKQLRAGGEPVTVVSALPAPQKPMEKQHA